MKKIKKMKSYAHEEFVLLVQTLLEDELLESSNSPSSLMRKNLIEYYKNWR